MDEEWLWQGGVVAEALGELLFSRVLPFLGWAGTYRGTPVSRTWRDGVDADARRELRRLARAARHVVGGVERGAGAGLFHEPLGEGDLASWEAALRAHAGPGGNGRVVALPSHVRALLRTVGASRVASASGYARTAANTLRPLGDWRLVRDLYAYFEYRRPFIFESADWPHPPAPANRTRGPGPWYFVVRAWNVRTYGEARKIHMALAVSVVDGLFWYYNSDSDFGKHAHHHDNLCWECIGTAFDYLRGGWGAAWDLSARQDEHYTIPGATLISPSDDPEQRRGVAAAPPPSMDYDLVDDFALWDLDDRQVEYPMPRPVMRRIPRRLAAEANAMAAEQAAAERAAGTSFAFCVPETFISRPEMQQEADLRSS